MYTTVKHTANRPPSPAEGALQESREGSKLSGENENWVQIDFVNLDQDFREFDVRWFTVSLFQTLSNSRKS